MSSPSEMAGATDPFLAGSRKRDHYGSVLLIIVKRVTRFWMPSKMPSWQFRVLAIPRSERPRHLPTCQEAGHYLGRTESKSDIEASRTSTCSCGRPPQQPL